MGMGRPRRDGSWDSMYGHPTHLDRCLQSVESRPGVMRKGGCMTSSTALRKGL